MLKLNTEITVVQRGRSDNKTFVFDYVTDINIDSGWDVFTDGGTITLPNRFTIRNKDLTLTTGDSSVFKRGDKITIKRGYNNNLDTIFIGYISRLQPGTPVIITVEDSMWLLKQRNIESKSWANPTIKEVIEYCLGDLDIDIDYSDDSIRLGKFIIDNRNVVNIISILDVLKKNLGILTFFVGETLKVGVLSQLRTTANSVNHSFSFTKNIISDSLESIREDDVSLVIHGISYLDNNTKIERWGAVNSLGVFEVTGATQQGEIRTISYYNITASELKANIERDKDLYIYTGYKGSFTTFGEPFVKNTDTVTLINDKIPDFNGTYIVKKVSYKHGVDGSRQEIELQAKI